MRKENAMRRVLIRTGLMLCAAGVSAAEWYVSLVGADGAGSVAALADIPEAFRDFDYYGKPRVTGGKLTLGAIQETGRVHGGPFRLDCIAAALASEGLTASAACPRTEEGRAIRGVSSFARCPVHRLAGDGTVETRRDAFLDAYTRRAEKAEKLEIRKPQDNSEFRLVKGLEQQRIVCAPVGNVADGRLWWFVDGAYAGETRGGATFAWRPAAGAHRITCSTDDGVTASVRVTVTGE